MEPKEYHRQWRKKNKAKVKEYNDNYRKHNRDEINKRKREWNKANPEKVREHQRRHKEKKSTGIVTPIVEHKPITINQATTNAKCQYCGKGFNAKRNTAKYCSPVCRVYHNRKQSKNKS
jgi:hypothetical protein